MRQGINVDEMYVAAVKKFQSKYSIRQTGNVGPAIRAKLNRPVPNKCVFY